MSLLSLAAAAALAPKVFDPNAGGVDEPSAAADVAVFPLVSDEGGGAVTDLTTSGDEFRDSDDLESRSELELRPRPPRRSPRRRWRWCRSLLDDLKMEALHYLPRIDILVSSL